MVKVGSRVRLVHENMDMTTHSHHVINEILRLGGVDGTILTFTVTGKNAVVELDEGLVSLDGRSTILVGIEEIEEIIENSYEDQTLPKALEDVAVLTANDLNGTHIGKIVALDTSGEPDAELYTSLIVGTLKGVQHTQLLGGESYTALEIEGKLGQGTWELFLNVAKDQEVYV